MPKLSTPPLVRHGAARRLAQRRGPASTRACSASASRCGACSPRFPSASGTSCSMKPGDILLAPAAPSTLPALVELEGVPRFTARPGIVNRRKALQLLSVIPKGETPRDAYARNRQRPHSLRLGGPPRRWTPATRRPSASPPSRRASSRARDPR